jgi:Ser/Thr protein kinase RdoA (MazF antagonist)
MDALAAAAERLLGVRFASVERISDERSPKIVLRCTPEGAGSAIVVKHDTRDDADARRRFANEWAGAAFLDGLAPDPPIGPRFLGGDRGARFVALADLAPTGSLVEPLTGDDPAAAEDALVAYAELLGRMHAATAGRIDDYRTIRDAIEPGGDGRSGHGRDVDRLAERVPALLASFGVEPAPGLAAELDAAMALLREPGPFHAYQHSDSCPDNFAATPAGPRLIDFEHSGFGHALLDASVVEMAFPTCWCANRVPDSVIARAAAAYRRAFPVDPEAFDDAYAAACAFWGFRVAIFGDAANFLAEDRQWGLATTRQRTVYWLDRLARVAAERGLLPAAGATAARLAAALRERWGPNFVELPLYPAFRQASAG